MKIGDLEKAEKFYLRSLELKSRINDKQGIAHTKNHLGKVSEKEERPICCEETV